MTFSPCLLSPIVPETFLYSARDTSLSYGEILKAPYYLVVPLCRDPELANAEEDGSINKYCKEET